MRTVTLLAAIAVAFQTPGGPAPSDIERCVASALSWRYRWIEPPPRDLPAIECSVAVFEEMSFAYCESTMLSMNIVTNARGTPRVAHIAREHQSFENALAEFRRNINRSGKPLGPIRRIALPVRPLAACAIDWSRTTRMPAEIAIPQHLETEWKDQGITLRYPVVCEGDPFYLLYFLKGGRVESIWEFEVDPEGLNFHWSYEAGHKGRALPRLAAENLKKAERWYTVP